MVPYPNIDPVALRLGPIAVHWYGLMYLFGFAAGWWLGRQRAKRAGTGWVPAQVDDLVVYVALGVVLGGRLGYILFYGFPQYLEAPLDALKVWQGGMSFHGGLLGVLVAMWLYGRRHGRSFLSVTDFIAPLIPPGLLFGRIGNFINGELWGRVSDVPWAMIFPTGGPLPRHPSQLYQAGLEGVALFIILWFYSSRPRGTGAVSGMFLIVYAVFRFSMEFVRVPDAHIGYLAFGWLTMGHVLTLPMLVGGLALLWMASRSRPTGSDPGRVR
jgi:phosphatidylglycerol:prolipoprotein diacylglycerol transferase